MSEEEKKAIEETKNALSKIVLGIDVNFDINILDVLLNLIEKQQKEIEKLKQDFNIVDHECERLEKIDVEKDITITKQSKDISNNLLELQKKDKIIDLMAEILAGIDFDRMCEECKCCVGNGCDADEDIDAYMDCIKQYFEKKARESNV